MRLKEFLKEAEENASQKWLQAHIGYVEAAGTSFYEDADLQKILSGKQAKSWPSMIVDEHGDIHTSGDITSVWIDGFNKQKYDCPIETPSWVSASLISGTIRDATLENLANIPDASVVTFMKCKIHSFKFPAKMFQNKTEMSFVDCQIPDGLLSLLKIENLNKLTASQFKNEKLLEALKIVTEHLQGSRDIPECQQELIEAGLQEYAKL